MEKFFALLLTTTVLLGLSACSGKPDGQVEQFPPTVYDGTGDVAAGAADRPGSPYKDRVESGRVAEFAARRRQRNKIIFSRDMCVRENTARAASVEFLRMA
ncbi:MAG: hypothetical protein KH544_05900 [Firmicutes bacterium]|nr:hypothetical protein [Bacillota bacterium]